MKKEIFVEAESFEDLGGWVIDQQSMETIHPRLPVFFIPTAIEWH